MNSCDAAMLDTKVLFDNLDYWSKAIGCAGSVGHQLKVQKIIFMNPDYFRR
jgi:hypothetical protein